MDIYNKLNKKDMIWSIGFLLLIIGTYLLYIPGIHGFFRLDDLPNLSPLGRYTDFSSLDNFWLFLLEGQSGPTGRPISLASFYLNDTHWPSLPTGFITTNILIHLLNGILVFWFGLNLSRTLELNKTQQAGFSLIATALWLLHPMQTTTVLYIIQRMTELSATFMLAGLIFYLYGREKLKDNVVSGFITLFIGVGLSLLFAILSKENGILLVSYILVVEFFLLQPLKQKPPKYFYYWLIPTVILPFIVIIIYLGLHTDPGSYVNRNFTLIERLLTEPRILFDYLHHIFIPDMDYITLFHDDYEISKNLFSPWTTLPSIIGILLLVSIAFILRKKVPLVAFAIAWFFSGHILESTVLPLELYFEHRNYLPILGMTLCISWYAINFIKPHKKVVELLISVFIGLYAFIVYQNATLYGKPLELAISSYKAHPHSERARQLYIGLNKRYSLEPDLIDEKKIGSNQKSMLYMTTVMNNLADNCLSNRIKPGFLDSVIHEAKTHTMHVSVSIAIMDFFSNWQTGKCSNLKKEDMEHFFLQLASLQKVKRIGILAHNVHFALAEIYKRKGDLSNTIINLEKAYNYSPNYEILKLRAAYLVSAGLYKEALEALNDTSMLKKNIRERLVLKIQQKELDKFKQLIYGKMQKETAKL